MSTQPRIGSFRRADLIKVGDAHQWLVPPGVGAAVRLNSGGPRMLIVDVLGDRRACAWPDGEAEFDWRCLRPA